jgi:hypothetical protein
VIPTWFLYLSGFSLVLLGGMQLQARPRAKGAGFYERFVNLGTLWSLVCIAVGVGIVLMALGYFTPFDRPAPHPQNTRRHS